MPAWTYAQTAATDTLRTNGIRIGVDIGKAANYLVSDRTNLGAEVSADVGFRNILFVAEAGYGQITIDKPAYTYNSDGVYGRIGVEKNMLKTGDDGVFIGARYGVCRMDFQAQNVQIADQFWESAERNFPQQSVVAHWLEGTASVKTKVFGGFYMGFTIRLKFRLVTTGEPIFDPIQIPGFGRGTPRVVSGFSYYLAYRIPFK